MCRTLSLLSTTAALTLYGCGPSTTTTSAAPEPAAAQATAASATPTTAPAAVPATVALSEAEKIERLIRTVETMNGTKFIRNGSEHSAADAGEHMRRKLKGAGDKVKTAEQFIDQVASKSEMSGQPYQIKLADGKVITAGEFLHARLREIEAGK